MLSMLFSSIFMVGVFRSLVAPAMFSMIPKVVPKHQLAAASAWFTSFFQLAMILGPALGGAIYAGFGRLPAFLLITLFAMGAAIAVILLSTEVKLARNSSTQAESTGKSIREGLEYIYKEKVILSAMSLDMFSVLFGGAVAILPMFSDQILNAGPQGLGLLRASPAIGAILMSLYLIARPLKVISGKIFIAAVAGFGVCTIGFGLSRTMPAALIFLFGTGFFDSLSVVIRGTLLQLTTPDQMRGRVSAVNSIFIGSSNEIGAFESGVAARFLGLVPSIIFGGSMTLLIVAGTWLKVPELRKVELR